MATSTIKKSTALEYITGAELFTASDSNLVELDASNTRFAKCGRIVYGQVRFSLRRDTSGSTKLFTPKTEALRAKWFPLGATFAPNYAVFPVFKTWDAGKIALCFMNDTWDLGIGAATAGDYIANFTYIART